MTEDECRHLDQEIPHLRERVGFLSGRGQPEQERLSCAMFLRALLGACSVEELIAVPNDGPPERIDVRFQDARFQVTEVLDEDCRRQDNAKAQLQRYEQARRDWRSVSFRDVVEPLHRLRWDPLSYHEVYARLTARLAKKASKYPKEARAALDALGVIQLTGRLLDPTSPLPDETALRQQGWRSVSFVDPRSRQSHVVYATPDAPTFLQEHVGQTRRQWPDPETFFRL
jgi:hypothetical protein